MTTRKEHWEGVHRNADPEKVNWYQGDPALSLELISTVSTLGSSILDVGGGGSVLVDRLLQAGHTQISVLDISSTALAHTRQRLGDRAQKVEWIVSDVTEFQTERLIDVWHDRAVFHFLREKEDRAAYVETLSRVVRSGGYVIMSTFAMDGPNRCAGLDTEQYGSEEMCNVLGPGFELIRTETETHLTPSETVQQFWYGVFRSV